MYRVRVDGLLFTARSAEHAVELEKSLRVEYGNVANLIQIEVLCQDHGWQPHDCGVCKLCLDEGY